MTAITAISRIPRELLTSAHPTTVLYVSAFIPDRPWSDPGVRVLMEVDNDKGGDRTKPPTGEDEDKRNPAVSVLTRVKGTISDQEYSSYRRALNDIIRAGYPIDARDILKNSELANLIWASMQITGFKESLEEAGVLCPPSSLDRILCAFHRPSKRAYHAEKGRAGGYLAHVFLVANAPPASLDIKPGPEEKLVAWVSLQDLNDIAQEQLRGGFAALQRPIYGNPPLINRLREQLGDTEGEVQGLVDHRYARAISMLYEGDPFQLFCEVTDVPCAAAAADE